MFGLRKKFRLRKALRKAQSFHASLSDLLRYEPDDSESRFLSNNLDDIRFKIATMISKEDQRLISLEHVLQELKHFLDDFFEEESDIFFYTLVNFSTKVLKSALSGQYDNNPERFNEEIKNLRIQQDIDKQYFSYKIIVSQMDAIAGEAAKNHNFDENSPEFKLKAKRYEDLKKELNNITQSIGTLEKQKVRLSYGTDIQLREETLKRAKAYETMDINEAAAYHEKVMAQRKTFLEESAVVEELYNEMEENDKEMHPQETDSLIDAIMKNRLVDSLTTMDVNKTEKIDDMSSKDLEREIEALKTLIQELSEKIESNEENVMQKVNEINKNSQQITPEYLEQTLKEAIETQSHKLLAENIGEGIDVVKKFLSNDPPLLSAAALVLRLEIESWFRYEKGIDFSSIQFSDMRVHERFKRVLDNEKASQLQGYWGLLNKYIHNNEEDIYLQYKSDIQKQKLDIMEIYNFIKEHDIVVQKGQEPDQIYIIMQKEDAHIKRLIMTMDFKNDVFSPKETFKKVKFAVQKQNKRKDYLVAKEHKPVGGAITNIRDIKDYYKKNKKLVSA